METHSSVPRNPPAGAARSRAGRLALSWLPALLWLSLILWASADSFSASNTSRFIEPALRWLFPHLSPLRILELHALIRKAAHVTEYAILALLFWRALRGTTLWGRLASERSTAAEPCQPTGWRWRPALGALATAALCAVVDEVHQARVPSRTGSPRDVMLDVCGASLALLLLWGAFSLRRRVPAREPVRM